MRAFLFTVGLCVLLTVAALDPAGAAGMFKPGKEDCACPSLVAEGTIPDTLNTLADIPRAWGVGAIVERVADEIKNMIRQFGVQTAQAEPAVAPEPPAVVEKAAKPEEKLPKEKPKKPKKEKKVKRPPAKI